MGAPVGAAPPTKPGAPTITSVTAGHRSVKIKFTPPADNGGAKITNYRAKCTSLSSGGVTRTHEGSKSPIYVAGLTAEKTYTCTVSARNRVGQGPASAPSDPFVVLPSAPGAPTINSVTPGNRSVRIVFTKPADNGGAKIVDYRAKCTSTNGGVKGGRGTAKSPVTVGGLTAGKSYTCTVTARNKVGLGPASAPSAPVTTLGH
jgi:hypothetical protein